MEVRLPSLSVIITTLNCDSVISGCLSRIIGQDYPKDLIETLVMDGGSSDRTKDIARGFGARVIEAGYRDNAESRKYLALKMAHNEILLYIDADNYILESDWLKKMVKPFIEDQEIIATYTLRYAYVRNETLMNRYYALFGVGDPVAFYLKKADRLPWFTDRWTLSGEVIEERETYYKVRFTPESLPTVGCNGFFISKAILEKVASSPEDFFHTDVNYDLVKIGYDKYGVVKSTILHKIGDSFIESLKRRVHYMRIHHCKLGKRRRYKLFDWQKNRDRLNLLKFILYTLTFLKPLYDALRGYVKVKDRAWLLHPFVCFIFLFAYTYGIVSSPCRKR